MTEAIEPVVVEREMLIAASPETIWPFLTEADKLVRWMGRVATIEAAPGGLFQLDYNGFDIIRGTFIAVEKPRRLVFSWGWGGEENPLPPGASEVEITLAAEEGGTRLRLVHRGLDSMTAGQHEEGWDHFLERLAARAEGRDPGPDAWAPRKAELLAAELRDRLDEAARLVREFPGETWNTPGGPEGWAASALAHHIASHAQLAALPAAVASGTQSPLAELTADDFHRQNAEHAQRFAGATKEAALGALAEARTAAVELIRPLSDDDVVKSAPIAIAGGAELTVEALIHAVVLNDLRTHVASLRQMTR